MKYTLLQIKSKTFKYKHNKTLLRTIDDLIAKQQFLLGNPVLFVKQQTLGQLRANAYIHYYSTLRNFTVDKAISENLPQVYHSRIRHFTWTSNFLHRQQSPACYNTGGGPSVSAGSA